MQNSCPNDVILHRCEFAPAIISSFGDYKMQQFIFRLSILIEIIKMTGIIYYVYVFILKIKSSKKQIKADNFIFFSAHLTSTALPNNIQFFERSFNIVYIAENLFVNYTRKLFRLSKSVAYRTAVVEWTWKEELMAVDSWKRAIANDGNNQYGELHRRYGATCQLRAGA